jgi:hypothetical protein
MTEQVRNIKWGAEKRLEFIDFRLFWEGAINRVDIMDQFGVSVPQASKDLSLYQEKAPNILLHQLLSLYTLCQSLRHFYLNFNQSQKTML